MFLARMLLTLLIGATAWQFGAGAPPRMVALIAVWVGLTLCGMVAMMRTMKPVPQNLGVVFFQGIIFMVVMGLSWLIRVTIS